MDISTIIFIAIIASVFLGGIGYFIYCSVSLEKMNKVEKTLKNNKK